MAVLPPYHLPLTGADAIDYTDWRFLYQFVYGAQQRNWWAGGCQWPGAPFQWYAGAISAITATSVTISGATWCGGTDDTSGNAYINPWGCVVRTGTSPTYYPTTWYLAIDDNDFTARIRVKIDSWTNEGVLTIDNIQDYVTSGYIPSLASLVGKTAYILGYSYAIWTNDRVWLKPNSKEYVVGTIPHLTGETDNQGNPIPDSPSRTILRDHAMEKQGLAANALAGKDLLTTGSDGRLHRISLTGNTYNTLQFADPGVDLTIGAAYAVVDAGAYEWPGTSPLYPFAWYMGDKSGWVSHDPADAIAAANMPLSEVDIPVWDGTECVDDYRLCMDGEQWVHLSDMSDTTDNCGKQPEKLYCGLNLYKSFRGIQLNAEIVSQHYVEAISYDGVAADPAHQRGGIPLINAAEMFRIAGINNQTGSTGDVGGNSTNDGHTGDTIAVSGITPPYTPIRVYFSIKTHWGDYHYGEGHMTNSTTLVAPSTTFAQDNTGTTPETYGDSGGKQINVSWGWTRLVPMAFRLMFDENEIWIPDINPDTGAPITTPGPINFATDGCLGIGTFYNRSKSANYINYQNETEDWSGNVAWTDGFADDTGPAFSDGDIARFVGDNYFDPAVHDNGGAAISADSGNALTTWYAHAFTGTQNPTVQARMDGLLSGAASEDGLTTMLVDSGKDWFDFGFFSGIAGTETGTATGGSTTSLIDTAKADANQSSPTNALNCLWHTSRFPSGQAYVGWTIEIDFPDGHGGVTTYQRLITSTNPNAVQANWSEPLPSAVTSGLAYRIKTPYKLNRYKGRSLTITWPSDGHTETATITGNSQTALFFTATTRAVAKGCTYSINDPRCGTTWKWNASAGQWQTYSGADSTRLGVQSPLANFHTNSRENAVTYYKRYGKLMQGDAITNLLFNEIYAAYNVLRHVRWDGNWVCDQSGGLVDCFNTATNGGFGATGSISSDCGTYPTSPYCEDESTWNALTNATTGAGAPYGVVVSECNTTDGCQSYQVIKQMGELQLTGICPREPFDVEFYAYADYYTDGHGGNCNYDTLGLSPGVNFQAWTMFYLDTDQQGTTTESALLGDVNWYDTALFNCGAGQQCYGWRVTDALAVLMWDSAYVTRYLMTI